MEEINILLAQSKLNIAIYSLELSLSDIQKKHPTRLDLIEPMKMHLNGLNEVLNAFRHLEREVRTLKSLNFNYHLENMELKYQNEQLRKTHENLINGL